MSHAMSRSMLALEISGIDRRTRRWIGVSLGIHLLLVLLVPLLPESPPAPEKIVEVTWLEPVAPSPPPAPAASPAPKAEPTPTRPAPRASKVHFARPTEEAVAAPRPQELAATRDRLRERLTSLQQTTAQALPMASLAAATAPAMPSLAGLPEATGPRRSVDLTRGAADGPPIELARTPTPSAAAPALQRLSEPVPRAESRPATTAGPSREVLAGIRLAGPVADRPLKSYAAPEYPEWAQRELVEGTVQLTFFVLPDGRVKENVMVEKTSGVEDFDRNAVRALQRWRFAALPAGATGEQWGSIRIEFRLDGPAE